MRHPRRSGIGRRWRMSAAGDRGGSFRYDATTSLSWLRLDARAVVCGTETVIYD